jgi:hypothetical protein
MAWLLGLLPAVIGVVSAIVAVRIGRAYQERMRDKTGARAW